MLLTLSGEEQKTYEHETYIRVVEGHTYLLIYGYEYVARI